MTYNELCAKHFAPLDEIIEALNNGEGINGLSYEQLILFISNNAELEKDVLNNLF